MSDTIVSLVGNYHLSTSSPVQMAITGSNFGLGQRRLSMLYLGTFGAILVVTFSSILVTTVEADLGLLPYCNSKIITVWGQRIMLPPEDATIVETAAPSGNLASTAFGNLFTVDDFLTTSPDPTSSNIGSRSGIRAVLKNVSLAYINQIVSITSPTLGIGAIAIQGIVDINSTTTVNTLVVQGGTGAFEFATGIFIIEVFSEDANHKTYNLTFSLTICSPLLPI